MFKKLLGVILVVFFLLIVSANTLLLTSEDETVVAVQPIKIGKDVAVLRLSRSVQIRTISHQDHSKFNPASFVKFHRFLEQSFPGLHHTLSAPPIRGAFTVPTNDWVLAIT